MKTRKQKSLLKALKRARKTIVRVACGVYCAEEGEGFVDVLVKMLIVVVVGAVLLAIMQTAVPQLFTDMLTKIRGIFSV